MTKVLFVQPFTVNANVADQCEGRTVVLDVAFNAGSPQGNGTPEEQFFATTMSFITALGSKLVLWLDHHDHHTWKTIFTHDPRFLLVEKDKAPACPPLITPELWNLYGEADTIVCHGDFDGIMSAVKYTLRGNIAVYPELDTDSIAIDSRVGTPSAQAAYYDEALHTDPRDDAVRRALYDLLIATASWDIDTMADATATVVAAHNAYHQHIQAETERLAKLYIVKGPLLCYVDARSAQPFDLTKLLLEGQKRAHISAVVYGSEAKFAQWTLAAPFGSNLPKCLGMVDFKKTNRVTLPGTYNINEIHDVIRKNIQDL